MSELMSKLHRLDKSKLPETCMDGKCPPTKEYADPTKYCLACLYSVICKSSSDWSRLQEALELLVINMRRQQIKVAFMPEPKC